jgi:hypothetical protein
MTEHARGFRAIADLGATVALWLLVSAGANVLAMILSLADVILIQIKYDLSEDMIRIWQAVPYVAWPLIALNLALVIMVAMWIYRAAHNARLVRPSMQNSPAWAVGWYFIPVANLWKPYQAMSEIWRISCHPDSWKSVGAPVVMGWWWAGWLLSNMISNGANRAATLATTDAIYTLSAVLSILACIASMVAALALRQLVRQVTAAQTNQRQAEVF